MGEQPAGMDLDIQDETAIMKPWGVLDVSGSAAIRPLIDQVMGSSTARHFLVDLDRVSFLDGSGLQELMRLRMRAGQQGKAMSVINGRAQVRRILSVTGSARLLDPLPLTS